MPRKNVQTDVFKHINMHEGDRNVCWEWKGKLNRKDGRPYFTVDGKRSPAYAIVLTLHIGPPRELEQSNDNNDQSTQMALHSCDNLICCNPFHLRWGTNQDNSNDMMKRDRHGLPATVIRSIRKLLNEGRTHSTIANVYGVSRETISAISQGRSHKKISND